MNRLFGFFRIFIPTDANFGESFVISVAVAGSLFVLICAALGMYASSYSAPFVTLAIQAAVGSYGYYLYNRRLKREEE